MCRTAAALAEHAPVSAQYDTIAREYQATKESPLRRYIEAYSFFRMIGDPVVAFDVGCRKQGG